MPLPAYVWASNPDSQIDDPGETFWRRGFIDEEPVAAAHLNYVINALQTQRDADFALFAVEHNTGDGKHTDVNADSINVAGGSGGGGGTTIDGSGIATDDVVSASGAVSGSTLTANTGRVQATTGFRLAARSARIFGVMGDSPVQVQCGTVTASGGTLFPLITVPSFSEDSVLRAFRIEPEYGGPATQVYSVQFRYDLPGYGHFNKGGVDNAPTMEVLSQEDTGNGQVATDVTFNANVRVVDAFNGTILASFTLPNTNSTGGLLSTFGTGSWSSTVAFPHEWPDIGGSGEISVYVDLNITFNNVQAGRGAVSSRQRVVFHRIEQPFSRQFVEWNNTYGVPT